MAASFREKYGKKILLWIVLGLVALGIAQPRVGSGVTGEDLIRVISIDEARQKCGPGRCPQLHQAYCTYFTAFQLKKHQWSFVTKYPALSKSRWARPGTPLIRELDGREVNSHGIFARWSSWPTRQEAFHDIKKSCPLFWWQYNSQYSPEFSFPPGHKFVSP